MQNVTRTMTEYEVTAYSVCEFDGEVGLSDIAKCTVSATHMNKGEARAALMEATGTAGPLHGGLEAGKENEVCHAY